MTAPEEPAAAAATAAVAVAETVSEAERNLQLQTRLAAAETAANRLVVEVRRVAAEASLLRQLIVQTGDQHAIALMPPPTVLSAFVSSVPGGDSSSLRIDADGVLGPAPAYQSIPLNSLYPESQESSSTRRTARSRASSSAVPVEEYNVPSVKSIASPASLNESPQTGVKLISTDTALPTQSTLSSNNLPASPPNTVSSHFPATTTPTATATTAVANANATITTLPPSKTATAYTTNPSNPKSSSTNTATSIIPQTATPETPLPPNSLAWTDIIRTRYPNFQRSTVQTSKHAREFIETRQIPFFRVTPTHSLGRSKPTYAIPPRLYKEFLEYFEDKFGGSGVLGRRRVGGDVELGQPGFDDALTATASVGGAVEDDDEDGGEYEGGTKGKKKPGSSGSISGGAGGLKKRAAGREDGDITEYSENSLAKKQKSIAAKSISKSGVSLVRYNTIVSKMMPDFKTLSVEARLAIKRGVKAFLQHQMGTEFEDCIMMTSSDNGTSQKPTYGIPEHLNSDFQEWVYVELKKCFPDSVVLPPAA